MATATIKLTNDEIAERGKEIYYRDILPQIEAGNEGRVVAIDVLTGEFEMAELATDSAAQLRIRMPDAIVFFMRVGYPTMSHLRSPRGRRTVEGEVLARTLTAEPEKMSSGGT